MSDRLAERTLIRRIRRSTPPTAGVTVGIGDDCAVLEPTAGQHLLATTDLLLEDVHFRRRYAEPADVGWKSLAVNLSDIASMGGRPRWALVAVTGPLGRSASGLAVLELANAPAGIDAAALAEVTSAHVRPVPRVAEGQWL